MALNGILCISTYFYIMYTISLCITCTHNCNLGEGGGVAEATHTTMFIACVLADTRS